MCTNKIFTFGDGFATGHIWPEWPQILSALVPESQLVNTAGIGAGNEFLVSAFVDLMPELENSTVIFQWPNHRRFDKMLQDKSWDEKIQLDPAYNFNRVSDRSDRTWWLSSASNLLEDYHHNVIQSQQSLNRERIYKTLVSTALEKFNCVKIFTSSEEQEIYSRLSRFSALRQNEVQPAPAVHFYWLREKVIPKTQLKIAESRLEYLEKLILNHKWVPYDPDRSQHWAEIVTKLNQ